MIRLETTTTEDDKVRLLETMRKYNEACNFVAERAFSLKLTNKYKLHKEVYREAREKVWPEFSVCCKSNRQSYRSIQTR